MKRLAACLIVACMGVWGAASAQDGLYASFIVGQKFVNNMPAFNDAVSLAVASAGTNPVGRPYELSRDFEANFWTVGATGYLLIAKRLMVGAKGWAFSSGEIVVSGTDSAGDAVPTRKLSLSGGIVLGTLGFNILRPNKLGFHLYPQLGLGVAPFVFHSKSVYEADSLQHFTYVVATGNDEQATITKGGFVVDLGLGVDWHPFKIVFPLFSGIEIWPLFHLEGGYSYIPGNINWYREVDQLDWAPDMKADGFYINAGIGLGLTAKTGS
jgi:hypothetical protein